MRSWRGPRVHVRVSGRIGATEPAPPWKEAEMFIGEIEEIGVIEPLQEPRGVPVELPGEALPVEARPLEEPVSAR